MIQEDFNDSVVDLGSQISNETALRPGVMLKYWLDGPVGLTLAGIGMVLNLIAIILLARQRVQRTFHMLLICLSFWDFGYLVMTVLCFAIPTLSLEYKQTVFIYLVPYAIPLAQICLSGSCCSTVALTIERYIAVCSPFFRLKHNIKARFYIIPILLFAPLYNFPRFFEIRTTTNVTYHCASYERTFLHELYSDNYSGQVPILAPSLSEEQFLALRGNYSGYGGCTQWNRTSFVDFVITDFRKDPTYVTVYVNYVNLIVNLIIPTSVLIVLNCMIYRALKRSQNIQRNRRGERPGGSLRKRNIRLTRIAIVIVCIFITCHLPRFIPNIMEMFMPVLPWWFGILITLNNLLQIINSTVNYLVYFGHSWRSSVKRSSDRNTRTQAEHIDLNVAIAQRGLVTNMSV